MTDPEPELVERVLRALPKRSNASLAKAVGVRPRDLRAPLEILLDNEMVELRGSGWRRTPLGEEMVKGETPA